VPDAETAPSIPDARDDLLEATYSRVFLRIIPFLMVLWVIAWIDRVNVGFAKLQMLHDLNFSEAVYCLGAGIFFLGYFLFEVPSNLLMMRIGAKKTIARITLGWGLTSMAMVFVKTSLMFYLLRFLLGVFEAGARPGFRAHPGAAEWTLGAWGAFSGNESVLADPPFKSEYRNFFSEAL
jgi:MFS family permease